VASWTRSESPYRVGLPFATCEAAHRHKATLPCGRELREDCSDRGIGPWRDVIADVHAEADRQVIDVYDELDQASLQVALDANPVTPFP